jgi:hypothetical protein
MGAAHIGVAQEKERERGSDEQDVFHRVACFLAAITARRLNWSLGALEAPLGPVVPTRGAVGAEAEGAAGGPDVLGGAAVGTTSARASAAAIPRRCASAVQDRAGASPSARRVARRTTRST